MTDGGRIAQSVLNRGGKQFFGALSLIALIVSGVLLGNNFLLQYALFCQAFQIGQEIPLRNEVDDISYGRVLFGTSVGILALLVLVPAQ